MTSLTSLFRRHAGFFIIAASAVSYMSTYYGLSGLIGSHSLLDTGSLLAAGLTFVIQTALIYFLQNAFSVESRIGRLLWFLPAVLVWMLSVGLGVAFWWGLMRAEQYSAEQFATTIHQVTLPLQRFAGDYQSLAQRLQRLAAYSRQMARREEKRGGTCGDGSPRGPGSRQRLRTKDAAIFSEFSTHFSRRSAQMQQLVAQLEQAVSTFTPAQAKSLQEQVNRVLRQAQLLADDERLRELRDVLRERLRLHEQGFRAANGAFIRCPDTTLRRHIRQVLALKLPQLPQRTVEVFDPSRPERTLRIYEELYRLLSWAAGINDTPPTFRARDIWLPLLLAMIVDMLIVISVAQEVGTERNQPLLRIAPEPRLRDASGNDVPAEEARKRLRAALRASSPETDLLRRFIVRVSPKKAYLFVPHGGGEFLKLRRLAEVLESGGNIRPWKVLVPVRTLSRWLRQLPGLAPVVAAPAASGPGHVDIYRLPPRLLAHLEQVLGADNGGEGEAGGPPTPRDMGGTGGDAPAPADADVPGDDDPAPAKTGGTPDTPATCRPELCAGVQRVVLPADERGHFYADVCLNGRHRTRMLVDTGATSVSLSWQDAEAAGVEMDRLTFDVPVETANGTAIRARTMLASVCLQGIRVENVEALVAKRGDDMKSLLGMNFLKRLQEFSAHGGQMLLRA